MPTPPEPACPNQVHLKTFDPATFYPALSAREKSRVAREMSLVTTHIPVESTLVEPKIPKDFDPMLFYGALSAKERTLLAARRKGGVVLDEMVSDEESLYPQSFFSKPKHVSASTRIMLVGADSTAEAGIPRLSNITIVRKSHRKRNAIIIGLSLTVAAVVIAVLTWLGTHNWLNSRAVNAP